MGFIDVGLDVLAVVGAGWKCSASKQAEEFSKFFNFDRLKTPVGGVLGIIKTMTMTRRSWSNSFVEFDETQLCKKGKATRNWPTLSEC